MIWFWFEIYLAASFLFACKTTYDLKKFKIDISPVPTWLFFVTAFITMPLCLADDIYFALTGKDLFNKKDI
jgi:hypothetical protein